MARFQPVFSLTVYGLGRTGVEELKHRLQRVNDGQDQILNLDYFEVSLAKTNKYDQREGQARATGRVTVTNAGYTAGVDIRYVEQLRMRLDEQQGIEVFWSSADTDRRSHIIWSFVARGDSPDITKEHALALVRSFLSQSPQHPAIAVWPITRGFSVSVHVDLCYPSSIEHYTSRTYLDPLARYRIDVHENKEIILIVCPAMIAVHINYYEGASVHNETMIHLQNYFNSHPRSKAGVFETGTANYIWWWCVLYDMKAAAHLVSMGTGGQGSRRYKWAMDVNEGQLRKWFDPPETQRVPRGVLINPNPLPLSRRSATSLVTSVAGPSSSQMTSASSAPTPSPSSATHHPRDAAEAQSPLKRQRINSTGTPAASRFVLASGSYHDPSRDPRLRRAAETLATSGPSMDADNTAPPTVPTPSSDSAGGSGPPGAASSA